MKKQNWKIELGKIGIGPIETQEKGDEEATWPKQNTNIAWKNDSAQKGGQLSKYEDHTIHT